MRWKRGLAVLLPVLAVAAIFSCRQKKEEPVKEKAAVTVRCYSKKAEKAWGKIVSIYRKEHGLDIKVAGPSEIIKEKGQPAVVILEDYDDYEKWKGRCMDLTDTRLYSWLLSPDMAVREGKAAAAVPCGIRGLGLVYNEKITDKYFELTDRQTKIGSMKEIQNMEDFKSVVQDMTRKKRELEIDGVFADPYFRDVKNGWQIELLDAALSLEMEEKGLKRAEETQFIYAPQVKEMTDLCLDHSCTDRKHLFWKSKEDALEEFAKEKAVMIQGDDSMYRQTGSEKDNTVEKKDIRYLPLFLNAQEKSGLLIKADDYMCINDEADHQDKKAAEEFLEWLYETDQGKGYVTDELGYTAPYLTFSEEDVPSDPLVWEMIENAETGTAEFIEWDSRTGKKEEFWAGQVSEYARTLTTWEEAADSIIKELKKPEEKKKKEENDIDKFILS